MADSIDAELLSIFRDEVGEYLATLNNALLQIETADASMDMLRELNRVAHSMKGAARAVGLKVVETIAHYMEEVFDAALHHRLKLIPDVCDTLYDGLDLIQSVVEGEENDKETLVAVLVRLEQVVIQSSSSIDATAAIEFEVNGGLFQETAADTENGEADLAGDVTGTAEGAAAAAFTGEATTLIMRSAEDSIRVPVGKLDRLMAESSELLVIRMQAEERQREVHALRTLHRRWRREWQALRAAFVRMARRMHDEPGEGGSDLNHLLKFLEHNQRHLLESQRHLTQLAQAMAQDTLRLTMLADQLQDDISGMRLVSFETLLGGFQRIVRDLARDMGKRIQFDVVGSTVEVDKTVLDALKDPVMHLLRNAVDHGIEPPDMREARGKPGAGRVTVVIEQRGNEIIVRVSDDGRGINPSGIRHSAVQAGILTTQEAETLSDEDARSLIFHPGLSTRDRVTAISGRGIGMDVVRERVESLRGRVSVQSQVGEGTTVTLTVPVSLTRIRCVIFSVGGEDYAVSSSVFVRMMTVDRDEIFTAENREMIVINDQPVPLVSLGDVLASQIERSLSHRDRVTIMALRAVDRTVAFEVDDLHSELELVLKPLGREIARAQFVSGAALLGTGQVIIVLDANDLIRAAAGIASPRHRAKPEKPAQPQKLRVLVVDDSITTRTLEKNILETAGFHVRVAIDGAEAWQLVNETPFDVIISDVEMPNMTGLELTREIKSNPSTHHIPVILLTSLGKPEHQQAGLKVGANAYLVKSRFDQAELLKTIWAVI